MGVITRLLISLFSVNKISHGDRCQTPSCRIQSPIKPLIWSIYWSPSYWSPISLVPFSLVPQLVGPPNTLLELIGPHLIGPQSHWSPVSLVPLFISHRTISPSEWSPSRWSPPLPVTMMNHSFKNKLRWKCQPKFDDFHWPIALDNVSPFSSSLLRPLLPTTGI